MPFCRPANPWEAFLIFGSGGRSPGEQRLSRPSSSKDSVPINQERVRKLMEHGLTEYQARVYLTLLDLGAATASQISPLSKVPRTRIYATMHQLIQEDKGQMLQVTTLRF